MKINEAVKPVDFSLEFKSQGSGLYKVLLDDRPVRDGFFDEDDVPKFIELKLKFLKEFQKLLN